MSREALHIGKSPSAELEGELGWLTLHGHPVHVLDESFPRDFTSAMDALAAADPARAVVLTGDSKVFCAGADVRLAPRLRDPAFGRRWLDGHHQALIRLAEFGKPTVCAVNGSAAGAGFNLALACDFVLAARAATFAQAFIRIGLASDMGSLHLLPRRVDHCRLAPP